MGKILKSLIIVTLLILSFCHYHYARAESWEEVVDRGFEDSSNDYAWSMATFKGKLYVGTLNSNRGAEIWSSSSGEPDTWEKVYNHLTSSNLGIRCMYADDNKFIYACTSNLSGTQILRSEDGSRWSIVARGGLGDWKNSSIRCMTRFGEYLYAGTGSKGAKLYRSKDGLKWELVRANPAFESTIVKYQNLSMGRGVVNNILIGEMAVFKNQLYIFTWTDDSTSIRSPLSRSMPQDPLLTSDHGASIGRGASIARSITDDPPVESIYGIISRRSTKPEFSRSPGAFEVWRSSDGVNWEKVVGQDDAYGNGMGFCLHDPENIKNDLVTSVTVFQGQLYLGTENGDGKTSVWRTAEGTRWERVLDFFELGERYNFYVWRMIAFRNRIFVGTMNMGSEVDPGVTGAQIWVSDSGDKGTFYNLIHDGFDGESIRITGIKMPKNYGIRSFGILNDTLFAGTATMLSIAVPGPPYGITFAGGNVGCEIWKLVQ